MRIGSNPIVAADYTVVGKQDDTGFPNVMAGAGPPSTTFAGAARQVMDGAPSRTMTRKAMPSPKLPTAEYDVWHAGAVLILNAGITQRQSVPETYRCKCYHLVACAGGDVTPGLAIVRQPARPCKAHCLPKPRAEPITPGADTR